MSTISLKKHNNLVVQLNRSIGDWRNKCATLEHQNRTLHLLIAEQAEIQAEDMARRIKSIKNIINGKHREAMSKEDAEYYLEGLQAQMTGLQDTISKHRELAR